jgi:hypothetical protein
LEYGLFAGKLDTKRVIIGNTSGSKKPSDLDGITYLPLDFQQPHNLQEKVDGWLREIQEIPSRAATKSVIMHTTKSAMNDPNRFWSELRKGAEETLIIVGDTNKSWLSRDTNEARALAVQFIELCGKKRRCGLVSSTGGEQHAQKWLTDHLLPLLTEPKSKRERSKRINSFRDFFTYGTVQFLPYKAVWADDKLFLIPNVHHSEFRDESLVIELYEATHPTEFSHYARDVERVMKANERNDIIQDLIRKANV